MATVSWEQFSPMLTDLFLRVARKTRGLIFPAILFAILFYFSFPWQQKMCPLAELFYRPLLLLMESWRGLVNRRGEGGEE